MCLKEKLKNKELIMLDGAMGTMLEKLCLSQHYRLPEELNISSPDIITEIHLSYLKSGSDIILTNTFGASSYKLSKYDLKIDDVIPAAVKAAKTAALQFSSYVALDIGPLGALLEPAGALSFESAYEYFAEQVKLGVRCGVDLIFIETMTDLYEMRAALLAAKEHSSLPVFATMSFDESGRTFSGCDAQSAATTLSCLGADAIGVNCSLGPDEIYNILKEMSAHTSLPIIAKPNAGIPKIVDNKTVFTISAEEFAEKMSSLARLGTCVLGGCCGTDPSFIALTKKHALNNYIKRNDPIKRSAVCSGSKTVFLDNVAVIGERINPTGKKAMKTALLNNDIGYILSQAATQADAGADILDINVGIPDINQTKAVTHIIKAVQSICTCPLQIDSNDKDVINAALRIYNGKPIVNSVTGEDRSLNEILPLIKKYGAAVVGLTLDENGIPKSAEERYNIAKKIITRSQDFGIPKEDVYIDCLALTVSADSQSALIALKALELVKKRLGAKTVLGVSNISFGLPARNNINNAFLLMALQKGLNLPIINPNAESTMDIISSYKALCGLDEGCKNYIERYLKSIDDKSATQSQTETKSLQYLIKNGISSGIEQAIDDLLLHYDAMNIVDEHLIPILDKVGELYEAGKIFLPQLISSSEAAKKAFGCLNYKINKNNKCDESKKQIILATVKGDVHDIGKNIVKVVLQNYGFEVIDLGCDVDTELIVSVALNSKARLIGLSALMTTTLKSMQQTIKALRSCGYKGDIMVGGAVLNEEYAMKINASYYGKNAQQAAKIAKRSLA